MSSTVRSYGYIAVLANPILDRDQREELSEKLYDADSDLSLNSEGTLLYSDKNRRKSMSERGDIYGLTFPTDMASETEEFMDLAIEAELPVWEATIRPYSCIWYNGSDSDMDSLTKEQFLKRTR